MQVVPRPLEDVFAFFADPHNLEAITPPWLRFRILDAPNRLGRGSLLRYRLHLFAVPIGWQTEITAWTPPRSFDDTQVAGPYRHWVHAHRFTAVENGTEIYDSVRYRVPGGPLGLVVERTLVRGWLREILDYRRRRLAELLG